MTVTSWLVAGGVAISVALALHSIINGLLLRRPRQAQEIAESVAILVPCRNEEINIEGLVKSLSDQKHLANVRLIFLDDASTDRTGEYLARASADHSIEILQGNALPSGWLGKPHACWNLANAARQAQVLVFVDADVRLEPHAVAQAITTMRHLQLDLVSPYPRQISATWSERLAQPLLQWSWLATLPLRWAERSTRASLSAANGQFLVMDANAYWRAGGHEAIRSEVLDDIRLLQAFKAHGLHGVVIDGSSMATCRMYRSWSELRAGYTKWLWSAFGSPMGALMVALVLAIAYLLPIAAAFGGSAIGWIGYGAAVLSRAVSATRSGDRIRDAVWHPLSIALLIVLIALSWSGRRRGTLAWKERELA